MHMLTVYDKETMQKYKINPIQVSYVREEDETRIIIFLRDGRTISVDELNIDDFGTAWNNSMYNS